MSESVGSWVYLFSLFTREALLFEALAIFALLILYSAFWIVQKRRLGSVKNVIPAGLVKTYLNSLIQEAEVLRAQLFGLLSASAAANGGASPALGSGTPSAEALAMLQAAANSAGTAASPSIRQLETKMAEQSQAMNALIAEKNKLEKELTEAKNNAAKTPAGAAPVSGAVADPAELQKFQDKINLLESRLAEYSVIEDDLANLKRLQQENAQLKASLASTGGTPVPQPAATPAPAVAPALTAEPAALPTAQPAEALTVETVAASTEAPAETSPAAPSETTEKTQPSAAPAQATAAPDFEKVVDQVEQELKLPEATPVAAAPPTASSTETPPPAAEKTDADLIAEFEKMLNS